LFKDVAQIGDLSSFSRLQATRELTAELEEPLPSVSSREVTRSVQPVLRRGFQLRYARLFPKVVIRLLFYGFLTRDELPDYVPH